MIPTDRLVLLFQWVLPRARRETGLRRTTPPPAGGVLNADHVRSGDDSIDVGQLVEENQLDVGRALEVGYTARTAQLTTRTVTAKVRSACSIRWGRRGATQQMSGQTDRPANRSDKRQTASPRTSRGSIPLASASPAAVAMRDEWRGRSSNRDSRRHARRHFSPPIDWRVTNERSRCHTTAAA
jgi:hypothetical protein